jgi:uncharacterized protein (UPF0332 family)
MAKADRALLSAAKLLEDDDYDGACDRAYYAMFNAARAALSSIGVTDVIKTHSGLVSAFSLNFVKTGRISSDYGKILNRQEDLRLIATYGRNVVSVEKAQRAVLEAGNFIGELKRIMTTG